MLSASGIIPGHKLLRPCYKFSAKTVESQTLDIAQLLFGQALRERGYYDIFLFDTEGNLVYTVFKELDYATNFMPNGGKWADTDLGNAFRAGLKAEKANTLTFFDFKPYAPSHGAPASFMSTPIFDEAGTKVGVLVFQMPIDMINSIMSEADGLGATGETMIVGADNLMRNDSRFTEKTNDILKTEIRAPAIEAALSGTATSGVTDTYRSMSLQIDAVPLTFHSTTWAIVAAQAVDEIGTPLVSMRNEMLLIGASLLALLTVIGFFISRSITRPITTLVADMSQLADGDTSVELQGADRGDEIGDMTKAVAVFRDNASDRVMLEADAEKTRNATEKRQTNIDALITSFRSEIQSLLEAVVTNAEQMNNTAKALTGTADETSGRASGAAEAAEEASVNVQTVAAAAEELAASIDEITRQVGQTKQVVDTANEATTSTSAKVSGLAEAV